MTLNPTRSQSLTLRTLLIRLADFPRLPLITKGTLL